MGPFKCRMNGNSKRFIRHVVGVPSIVRIVNESKSFYYFNNHVIFRNRLTNCCRNISVNIGIANNNRRDGIQSTKYLPLLPYLL